MMNLKYQIAFVVFLITSSACSSGLQVRQDALPKFENSRTLSYPLVTVWRGVEAALENIPKAESESQAPSKTSRALKTQWITEQSRDKYVLTQAGGIPKRKYLEIRYRYLISAQSATSGTLLDVKIEEQVEQLNNKGESLDFSATSRPDTSRARDLLDKIQMAILRSP